MEALMNEVNNTIQSKNMSIRDLAKGIGVGRNSICNGLKNTTEMKFDVFLKLILKVYDDRLVQSEKIKRFIAKCTSNLNIRKVLAYCQCMGDYQLIDYILQLHKGRSELKKYLVLYGLFNKRNLKILTGQKLLDALYENDFSNNAECQVLMNTLYMAAMYDKQNYNAVIPYGDLVEVNLPRIENEFLKETLRMLYNERIIYIHLLRNDIEKCRASCLEIIESNMSIDIVKSTAWCCLGESYIFESVKKAEEYIKKAIDCLQYVDEKQRTQKYFAYKTTLAFLYTEYNFNLDAIDFMYVHKAEKAYYECKFGDKNKGLQMFDELKRDSGLTSFQMYYLSVVNNDILMLRESFEKFEKKGNLFYIKLAKSALIGEGALYNEKSNHFVN